jgi:hypothetical protein
MQAPPLSVLHVDLARGEHGPGEDPEALMAALDGRPGLRQARLETRGPSTTLRALLAAFGEDWDVVHAHGARALRAALAVRALAGASAPIVGALAAGREPGRLFPWQRADLVIAASRQQRDAMIDGGIDRRRVVIAGAVSEALASADDVLACYRALARRSP